MMPSHVMLMVCFDVSIYNMFGVTDDHTRVKLAEKHNKRGSDYINASFIVSFGHGCKMYYSKQELDCNVGNHVVRTGGC